MRDKSLHGLGVYISHGVFHISDLSPDEIRSCLNGCYLDYGKAHALMCSKFGNFHFLRFHRTLWAWGIRYVRKGGPDHRMWKHPTGKITSTHWIDINVFKQPFFGGVETARKHFQVSSGWSDETLRFLLHRHALYGRGIFTCPK